MSKPIDEPTQPGGEKAVSGLKLYTLVGLIFANMVGAGVFTTSGFALADLGSPHRVMLAWVIGGLIAMCGALSYGALARHLTESGGEYLFLSRVIHPMAGFIAGCVSLVAGFTGAIAFAAMAFENYVQPLLGVQLPAGTLAVSIVLIGAVLHSVRVSLGTGVQDVVVGLKFVLILIFIGIAVVSAKSFGTAIDFPQPPAFSPTSFAMSLVWISLSYSGYNAAVYVAGEAREKQRLVPKAIWLGTLIVTFIYLGLNAVFMYLVPYEITAGKEDVAAVAANYLGGDGLAMFVRVIIGVSLLTSVFAMVMIGPRVYAKMADDGVFPDIFRFQGRVPRAAIALQAGAAILFISFTSLKSLLSYLGLTLSLCAALTVFCLFLVKNRESTRLLKVPGYPIVPAFFIAATVLLAALAAWRNPVELLFTLITFIAGAILYFLARRKG